MKIIISIPVHEEQDVVINQIDNIHKYIPKGIIVIHLNRTFVECDRVTAFVRDKSYVYINPERLNCDWGNIIDAHISNYKYAKKLIEFDYILFQSSNDMYIIPGVEKYISCYAAGFHVHKIYKKSRWWPSGFALEDPILKEITNIIGADIVATQIEGSFYKKEIFDSIVRIIEQARLIVKKRNVLYAKNYTREEVYFSTIAYKLISIQKGTRGYPVTYSEVHDFDRFLWRVQHLTWGIYHRLFLHMFLDRKKYDYFESAYTQRIIEKNPTALNMTIIKKLIGKQNVFLSKHRYLNDSVSKYQLYGDRIFAVKRVPRDMDNPLRIFINSL